MSVPAPTTAVPIVRNEAGTEIEMNKRRHWNINIIGLTRKHYAELWTNKTGLVTILWWNGTCWSQKELHR